MKTIFLLLILALTIANGFSQVSIIPTGFDYQAIIRDTIGSPKANQTVIIKFGLYPSQIASLPDYEEEHTLQTDEFGLVYTIIGQGTQTAGTVPFSGIDWKGASYYIEVKVKDGTQFYLIGNRQPLMSVPYALVAKDVINSVPVGTVVPYMGTTAPDGWLLCDGSTVSRTTYTNLFSVIGNSCGNGDGSTTFNLPDFRGRFLRGFDGTAGNDPDASTRIAMNPGGNTGNNLGTIQEDTLMSHSHSGTTASGGSHTHTASCSSSGAHTHTVSDYYDVWQSGTSNYPDGSDGYLTYSTRTTSSSGSHSHTITVASGGSHTHTISSDGGSETRPKNVYVNYIIKY